MREVVSRCRRAVGSAATRAEWRRGLRPAWCCSLSSAARETVACGAKVIDRVETVAPNRQRSAPPFARLPPCRRGRHERTTRDHRVADCNSAGDVRSATREEHRPCVLSNAASSREKRTDFITREIASDVITRLFCISRICSSRISSCSMTERNVGRIRHCAVVDRRLRPHADRSGEVEIRPLRRGIVTPSSALATPV